MTDDNPKGYAHPELLATPAALASELADGRAPTLLDLRPAEQYAAGHLPGAVHLDLWGLSLTDTDPAPLKSFLWIIEHLLGERGVSAARPVVVYDEVSGTRAARAFWFLEFLGHPSVRVLDGGVRAWVSSGLPLSLEHVAPTPTGWTGARRTDLLATYRDVLERLGSPDAAIVDTRSDEEYLGTLVRSARGGRVPGAIHLEWTHNLGPDGAFKPAVELGAMYERAGITPDREVVTYCQGGYRAAHSYLALRLLGYPRVRNYLGSWREWGDRAELPIEVAQSSVVRSP